MSIPDLTGLSTTDLEAVVDTRSFANLTAAMAAATSGQSVRVVGAHTTTQTVTVPAGVSIIGGPGAKITTAADIPILRLTPSSTPSSITGVEFTGSLGASAATLSSQYAIDCLTATVSSPVRNFTIEDCRFTNLHGGGVRIKHLQSSVIRRNAFTNYGYAGVAMYSARSVTVESNTFEGTGRLPSYSGNSYGVFASTYEPDGTVGSASNPFSTDVQMIGNTVRNQSWEALETHGGQRISFIGNFISGGTGAGISAVGHGSDAGVGTACTEIMVADNTIIGHATLGTTRMGIVLRGDPSNSSLPGARYGSGVITGNYVEGCGDSDSLVTGGIHVANCEGVAVSGNVMRRCRSTGVILQDSPDTTVTGNTVIDVWRASGTSAGFGYSLLADPVGRFTLTGNVLRRGDLQQASIPAGSNINLAGYHGSNVREVTVYQGANIWPEGTLFGSRQQAVSASVRGLREIVAASAPTGDSWIRGDKVMNSQPARGAPVGWVCTNAGTPGTWRAYGTIS